MLAYHIIEVHCLLLTKNAVLWYVLLVASTLPARGSIAPFANTQCHSTAAQALRDRCNVQVSSQLNQVLWTPAGFL